MKEAVERRTPLAAGSAVAKILKFVDDASKHVLPVREAETGDGNGRFALALIHYDTLGDRLSQL
ncbi:UNVERIFIED_ORG: hypothetical protein GGD51_000335 [Rhizobium esperanzae]